MGEVVGAALVAHVPTIMLPEETRLEIKRALERARTSTEALLAPVSDDDLVAPVSPGVPPLAWSYAHVARFEELWILRTVGGARPIPDAHDHVYDAFRRERSNGSVSRSATCGSTCGPLLTTSSTAPPFSCARVDTAT